MLPPTSLRKNRKRINMRLGEARQAQIFPTDIEQALVASHRLALTWKRDIEPSIALKLS
jgi:hypothetical protein